MPIVIEDVWPISADNPGPKSLSSFNGMGFGLKGFSRVDAAGYCFATRWFMILWLPIIPLGRYYLRETGMQPGAGYFDITTRYHIAGTANLHPGEILRTYAFCWLTPAAIIVPLVALLARADDFPFWLPIAAVAVWPITAILLVAKALTHYRKHWAPIREVYWHDADDEDDEDDEEPE